MYWCCVHDSMYMLLYTWFLKKIFLFSFLINSFILFFLEECCTDEHAVWQHSTLKMHHDDDDEEGNKIIENERPKCIYIL